MFEHHVGPEDLAFRMANSDEADRLAIWLSKQLPIDIHVTELHYSDGEVDVTSHNIFNNGRRVPTA